MAECRPQNYPKLKDYKPSRFMLPTCHYDAAKADRAVTFIENLRHTKGKWAGKRFWLLPWQEQIIRDVFGIVDEKGNRQFRTAYVEIGKKNGKSELAAAVALYLLFADNEPSAEVYGTAADRQQASIVFDVAHQMVQMTPALLKRCKIMAATKRMGNAEERAFITGDGVGKPLGLLAETGGAKVGVTAAQKDAVTFDEIFKLYYALKAPYRKKAQFLCNEALVLQLMTIKDNNGNYIWKPGLEIGKPDTLLNRPLKTSAFMPEIKGGSKVMAFGDYSYYWVADRQNRTFRRLNELYARTDQVGFLTTQRVDGKLILPEAVQLLQMAPQG